MFVKDTLIIIGSFVLHFISFGMIKSFGVIYTALIEYFDSTRADTGWIASLGAGIALLFGPVAGILEERFGCQLVAFLGSICIGIGMATSSFVTNIHLFYLTYGTITGIGFSLCHLASSVAVNRHFEKRRVTAVALSNTGSGIGTMVLPILGSFLTDRYGWPGTFLISSGVGLQGAYCGIMIKTLGPSSIRSAQGLFGIYLSVIVVDIVGKNNLSLAYGYLICMEGIAVVAGPPLAGLLYDVRGDYHLSFICCGIMFAVGGVLSIIAGAIKTKRHVYTINE